MSAPGFQKRMNFHTPIFGIIISVCSYMRQDESPTKWRQLQNSLIRSGLELMFRTSGC